VSWDNAHRELQNWGRRTLIRKIRQRLAARKKNASGALSKSTTWNVTSSPTLLRGTGEAFDYWKWAGNGRPPGGMPPVSKLERWAKKKGLGKGAGWAVAKKIQKEGSKDYREGKENIFLQVINEEQENIEFITDALMKDASIEIFTELEKLQKEN